MKFVYKDLDCRIDLDSVESYKKSTELYHHSPLFSFGKLKTRYLIIFEMKSGEYIKWSFNDNFYERDKIFKNIDDILLPLNINS